MDKVEFKDQGVKKAVSDNRCFPTIAGEESID
jgi:hypothetical protein